MIELDLEQLPEGEEVLTILKSENAPLKTWLELGVSLNNKFDLSMHAMLLALTCVWFVIDKYFNQIYWIDRFWQFTYIHFCNDTSCITGNDIDLIENSG